MTSVNSVDKREAALKRMRAYYARNKEQFRERNKKYRIENREKIKASRSLKLEKIRETGKAWRASHKEHLAEKMRKYRRANPEIVRKIEERRKRTDEQRAKFNAYRRDWAKKNPDKVQQAYQRRRARLTASGNTLTATELKSQRMTQNGKCYYCKGSLDNKGMGHIDHKQPLSRGGMNCAANIAIACSICNLKKGTKTELDFLELRSRLTPVLQNPHT